RRILRWIVRGAGLCAAAMLLIGGYFWISTPLPTPENLRARAAIGNTRILDRHGQLLYELPDPLSGRQRPVALDEIPLALRQATIAVEDRTFYSNPGVDLRGILRAAWLNLRSGQIVAGGSTITQQLARNFLLDPQLTQQQSFTRKLREAVLALKLTASYPKDEILALYLNQTYYGGLAYGAEAAAQHFFGKPVRDLDLAESALLAGLPQAPSHYDPVSNQSAAIRRQAEVLDAMAQAGLITPAQAKTAQSEPLQFATSHTTIRAPHFVHYVLDQLTAEFGADTVARGGLTITTTLDADLQAAAQSILQRQIAALGVPQNGGPDHQVRNGAVVVLDPSDGAILTMVGSPNFGDAANQGQVNAAIALRQPGSAIKPLTYAAALEQGWTPASTILDVPTAFETREGQPYTPQNYDRAFHGPLSLREALATSSNISAVQLLDAIGVPSLLDIAARLGITTLQQDSGRFGLALTLGGGEVTPLELTAAYAAFANGGQRVTPYAIVAIQDAQGNDRTQNLEPRTKNEQRNKGTKEQSTADSPSPAAAGEGRGVRAIPSPLPAAAGEGGEPVGLRDEGQPNQALSPQVAYLISDMLSDRYARMRAFGEVSALDVDRPAAAKTGTTSDWRDNWTIGYTPDRAVGVWVGNADGQPMENISGVTGAGPVWHEVMMAAHRGLPARSFQRPDGIVEVQICAEGGKLPSPTCPGAKLERFVAGTQPTQPDDTHVVFAIDPDLDCRAPAGYPHERTVMRSYRRLPPEAETWMDRVGMPRVPQQICPLPDATADQAATDAQIALDVQAEPVLSSPVSGSIFSLSRGIPTERQQIEIQARAGGDIASLTIYIDGAPLATFSGPPYRAFWPLTPGLHRAHVVTKDRQGSQRISEQVEFVVQQP
ncbi:MAG: PBP1A family penicillin-binding protein, partial [Chloroflexi bacterium]|nr:PBP1A family penicillin-binding protein [Chloroflexota bacterium]